MAKVAVILGSGSDIAAVKPCLEVLNELGITYDAAVSSAHRTPDRTVQLIRAAEAGGVEVFICAAGMAAHLAGAVAARTLRPVIGLPLTGGALAGMDALFSTVQMPAGYPVATVAINGAKNAAWLAAEILALHDESLRERIAAARAEMARAVEEAGAELQKRQ